MEIHISTTHVKTQYIQNDKLKEIASSEYCFKLMTFEACLYKN